MDVGTTVRHTWDTCVSAGSMILDSLKGLFTRGEGLDQMAGPVGVINVIAQETRTYKLMGYLNMLMMISINLGLVNLLPIPGLDGSRAVFLLIEGIFRKPVPRNVEAYIHLAGYLVLFGILIFFTYRDILHLFR
jgi:regulator of sigma E protease